MPRSLNEDPREFFLLRLLRSVWPHRVSLAAGRLNVVGIGDAVVDSNDVGFGWRPLVKRLCWRRRYCGIDLCVVPGTTAASS